MKYKTITLLLLSACLLTFSCDKEEPQNEVNYKLTAFDTPPAPGNPGGLNDDYEVPFSNLDPGWSTVLDPPGSVVAWSNPITLPFEFSFADEEVTSCKISSSGVLTFSTNTSLIPSASNQSLPSSSIPDKSVCVWGLEADADSYIVSKTFGVAPNRQLWFMYVSYSIPASGCWTYWGIMLEETSNKIYIVDMYHQDACDQHLTIGVQIDASRAIQTNSSPNQNQIDGSYFDDRDNYYYMFNYTN